MKLEHSDTVYSLTVLSHVQLVDGVDVAQVGDASLDLGASLPRRLVDPFDHLLLLVDPVQVVPEHGQAHRLQDVRVRDHDPIGSWLFLFKQKKKQHREKNKRRLEGKNFRMRGNRTGEKLRGEGGGEAGGEAGGATASHWGQLNTTNCYNPVNNVPAVPSSDTHTQHNMIFNSHHS